MEQSDLVSVQYIALRLSVSVRTVWRLAGGGTGFPKPIKIGRSTRFALSEVNAYIEGLLNKGRKSK